MIQTKLSELIEKRDRVHAAAKKLNMVSDLDTLPAPGSHPEWIQCWQESLDSLAERSPDGSGVALSCYLVLDMMRELLTEAFSVGLVAEQTGNYKPYTAGDRNALDLALAFLDDVLHDADLPRVNRKALPPLGGAGWATAWLGQVTLARLAAVRVQPLEVQRRIHVAATELERVLFALFDRAVPVAEEAPPSPKGGRRAAT